MDDVRGHSSVGRASRSQCEGQGFDSPWLHHQQGSGQLSEIGSAMKRRIKRQTKRKRRTRKGNSFDLAKENSTIIGGVVLGIVVVVGIVILLLPYINKIYSSLLNY